MVPRDPDERKTVPGLLGDLELRPPKPREQNALQKSGASHAAETAPACIARRDICP